MLPPHESFLASKSAIVLGAGSSKEYDFPLWDELREKMIPYVDAERTNRIKQVRDAAAELLQWLEAPDERSVDKFVSESEFEMMPRLFSETIEEIFSNLELKRLKEPKAGWIDKFSQYYMKAVKSRLEHYADTGNIGGKCTFISFNYERHFLHTILGDGEFQKELEIELREKFNFLPLDAQDAAKQVIYQSFHTIHPHGCLGQLQNTPMQSTTRYGSMKERTYGAVSNSSLGSNIIPADLSRPQFNASVKSLQDAHLARVDQVYFFGLSRKGAESSKLTFGKNPPIYYSNYDSRDKLDVLFRGCKTTCFQGSMAEIALSWS